MLCVLCCRVLTCCERRLRFQFSGLTGSPIQKTNNTKVRKFPSSPFSWYKSKRAKAKQQTADLQRRLADYYSRITAAPWTFRKRAAVASASLSSWFPAAAAGTCASSRRRVQHLVCSISRSSHAMR